jgi:hypothetical protein
MGKRAHQGAKVIAALDPVDAAGHEPPADLSPAAAALWRDAVADIPAGHLRGADRQTLRSYVRLKVIEEQLHAEYERAPSTELRKELREHARACSMLATKCRLVSSANSRIDQGTNRRTLDRKSRAWLKAQNPRAWGA